MLQVIKLDLANIGTSDIGVPTSILAELVSQDLGIVHLVVLAAVGDYVLDLEHFCLVTTRTQVGLYSLLVHIVV